MEEKEIWKPIEGYENYQVSNFGVVKSLKHKKEIILIPYKDIWGYLRVTLCKNGNYKHFKIHRLVAQAFIPNLNNYPQVNHIDENRLNNHVDNLEWCTAKYNSNYGNRTNKLKKTLTNRKDMSKPIDVYDLNMNYIETLPSEAEVIRKYNVYYTNIVKCCNGGYWSSERNKWVNFTRCKQWIFKWSEN
jgi:hypothetical protein